MNKELFSYFLVIAALVIGAVYYNTTIQSPIISSLNYIKTSYHNTTQFFQDAIDRHTFQASLIQTQKEQLKDYEKNKLIIQELTNEISDIYKINNSTLSQNPNVELVRSISYQKFGDFNRVWIDMPDYNASKIYGLVYQGLVAGIVIPKNERALGVLNRDIKSTYAVYVGEQNAPGIAHGNNEKNIMVKFIPTWFKIKTGDEVTTSGLDNIFFAGLKVGRVLSVTSSQGYQNAIIEQYYQDQKPNYFHLIRKIK
ncbi:rod shape-determining protein MreC [Sulfurimonas aquatica]|uniref:Rod shape-determining protein MreC n=1 Tax=Sulfurimonas aquatica TaxID=2672570 RepID=A0A975GCM0_9BACT|nr:rod shape-determining protein MreC [Sulfurimonas aquatica]QSZ41453.1 rod shape-determining protein MreC [Sulfurimonas aquatica]